MSWNVDRHTEDLFLLRLMVQCLDEINVIVSSRSPPIAFYLFVTNMLNVLCAFCKYVRKLPRLSGQGCFQLRLGLISHWPTECFFVGQIDSPRANAADAVEPHRCSQGTGGWHSDVHAVDNRDTLNWKKHIHCSIWKKEPMNVVFWAIPCFHPSLCALKVFVISHFRPWPTFIDLDFRTLHRGRVV